MQSPSVSWAEEEKWPSLAKPSTQGMRSCPLSTLSKAPRKRFRCQLHWMGEPPRASLRGPCSLSRFRVKVQQLSHRCQRSFQPLCHLSLALYPVHKVTKHCTLLHPPSGQGQDKWDSLKERTLEGHGSVGTRTWDSLTPPRLGSGKCVLITT
jgi:hypothetical protein